MAGETDFVTTMAFPLPVTVTVIGELLGIPAADRSQFQILVRDWAMVLELLSRLAVDKADAAATRISDHLEDLAAERRLHPREDLVSSLVLNEGDERLSAEELVTMLAPLLAAGFETTTGLLTNGLLALLAHPDQAIRDPEAYDEPDTLRLHRSAPPHVSSAGASTTAWEPRDTTL